MLQGALKPLYCRFKAGFSGAWLSDASGCFRTRFKTALKLVEARLDCQMPQVP